VHCANTDGEGKLATTDLETIEQILTRFNPAEVEFTGGEPLTRQKLLLAAVAAARKRSDFVMINTNMELLDEQKLIELEKAGLTHIHFAVLALDPELHRAIRGKPFADIEKVKHNIEAVLEKTNLKVIAEFVPMKQNLHEFPAVYRYIGDLRKKHGERIVELEVGRLIPMGRAVNQLAPPLDEQFEVLESIGRPEYPVEVFCFGAKGTKRLANAGFVPYLCDAGEGMFYFNIDGSVLADNFSGVPMAKDFRSFRVSQRPPMHCPFR
jgi:MoaA/NifB/PqqE/SkfB family radical SAM enzyme